MRYILFIGMLVSQMLFAQEQVYFNNTYYNSGFYSNGLSILELDGNYLGYGSTNEPDGLQKLLFFKISGTGAVIDWNPLIEPGHKHYYGNVGGAFKQTFDNKFIIAYHEDYSGNTVAVLRKLDTTLSTEWVQSYNLGYYTIGINCTQTADHGYLVVGWSHASENDFSDCLLIKTDSSGNYQWHQTYGGNWAEHGENVIMAPDGGYLIGGYFWKPGYTHSLNAMVVKTDSMGNEEWTKYYGNPNIDDDMALVAMADDGNYLVATVYGEIINTPYTRSGRISILKIDNSGGIIWDKKVGVTRDGYYIKNFRITGENEYIANGWSKLIDSSFPNYYPGWILKLDQNGDSLWFRDYYHFNGSYDENHIYDVSQTSDNGYITVGKANVEFGTEQMWVLKLDSMGCDTPGCALGTNIFELPATKNQGLMVWPNPTTGQFAVRCFLPDCVMQAGMFEGLTGIIRVYDSQAIKVEEIRVPAGNKTISIEASGWTSGLYYLQYLMDGEVVGSAKVIRN